MTNAIEKRAICFLVIYGVQQWHLRSFFPLSRSLRQLADTVEPLLPTKKNSHRNHHGPFPEVLTDVFPRLHEGFPRDPSFVMGGTHRVAIGPWLAGQSVHIALH